MSDEDTVSGKGSWDANASMNLKPSQICQKLKGDGWGGGGWGAYSNSVAKPTAKVECPKTFATDCISISTPVQFTTIFSV